VGRLWFWANASFCFGSQRQRGGDAASDPPTARHHPGPDGNPDAASCGVPWAAPHPFLRHCNSQSSVPHRQHCVLLHFKAPSHHHCGLRSVSRTVTEASYILNVLKVKCLINHHLQSPLYLSTVVSYLDLFLLCRESGRI